MKEEGKILLKARTECWVFPPHLAAVFFSLFYFLVHELPTTTISKINKDEGENAAHLELTI